MDNKNQICETCFRIACRQCEWVATQEEVLAIQNQTLTACPKCGWKPGDEALLVS